MIKFTKLSELSLLQPFLKNLRDMYWNTWPPIEKEKETYGSDQSCCMEGLQIQEEFIKQRLPSITIAC